MGLKELKEKYPNASIKKVLFKDHNYEMNANGTTYYIKFIKAHDSSIVTVNSKYVWEVKYGKGEGINFKTTNKVRVDMKSFMKLKNRIVVFRNKPYKILQYINESEVVDISQDKVVHDIKMFNRLEEIDI